MSFLCNRFVTSIFPEFIRLQIFPIDRQRALRGKELAYYIQDFDAFVAKSSEHEIFDQGIRPKTPTAQTPVPTRLLGQIPNSN